MSVNGTYSRLCWMLAFVWGHNNAALADFNAVSLSCGATASTQYGGSGAFTTPLFEDQFNGTTLDSSVWTILQERHVSAGDIQTNLIGNAWLDGRGLLHLDYSWNAATGAYYAAEITTSNRFCPQGAGVQTGTGFQNIDTACPGSQKGTGSRAWKYVRFEVCGKLPPLDGSHANPAYWLLPDNGDWPGEIDIMERMDWLDRSAAQQTLIWGPSGGPPYAYQYSNWGSSGNVNDGAFHLFAVEWTPSAITFYVDNIRTAVRTGGDVTDPSSGAAIWANSPYNAYLILQGAAMVANPAPTGSGWGTHLIDYVRVWGNANSISAVNGSVAPPPGAVSLAVTAPLSGATISGTTAITTAVSSNVTRVEFYVDNVYRATTLNGAFNYNLDTTTLPNGSHTITVVAYDAAWNMKIVSVPVTVSNGSLVQPVSLSITSPGAGATVSGAVSITTAVSSNVVRVEFYADNAYRATDLSSPFSYSLDSKTLSNGVHTITVVAYDAAWNMKIVSVPITVLN
jgi:beta-glucanase (GH16 family)